MEGHAGQPVSLRERAKAVQLCKFIYLSDKDVAARVLPPLGLEPHPRLVRRLRELARLPDDLLGLLSSKGFSLRRALPFCRLDPAEAALLAPLCRHLGLGARKLEETVWALREISARDRVSLAELFRELELGGDAAAERAGPGRAAAVERIDRRRFPSLWARRDLADAAVADLAGVDVAAHYDRNLNHARVSLGWEVQRVDDLDRIAGALCDPKLRRALERLLEALR